MATTGADLRSFLDDLGDRLLRVDAPVDPLTQIGYLCSESTGPVEFHHLTGYPGWRLCDILVKTRELQALALRTRPDDVVPRLAACLAAGPGTRVRIADPPCQEVQRLGDQADLLQLPIPVHSVGDAGRYLGSAIAITRDPATGNGNEAFLRALVRGPRELNFRMAARHNLAHYRQYEALGQPMPAAFVIGLHPAYEIVANYSGRHEGFDELDLGSRLLGEPLEVAPCLTLPLEVPARAEIVIEGWVAPGERADEGPFGEFTNYLSGSEGPAPLLRVTAISHRRDPIFRHIQATRFTDHQPLVALPMEATLLGRLRDVHGFTEVHDVFVPPWASNFVVLVRLSADWEGQARDVLLAALSGPNLHPKVAIAVDDDVDVYDARDVLWALSTRVNPARDVLVLPLERNHSLDISAATTGDESNIRVGSKLLIDATKPPRRRTRERARFRRLDPRGFDDPTLEELLRLVRRA